MSDLVTWLRARLDEDEAVARAAHPGPWAVEDGCFVVRGDAWCIGVGGRMDDAVAEVEDGAEGERAANAAHIARHDPARVLAEVAAKRAIVEWIGDYEPTPGSSTDGILRLLAVPYAACEGYRSEWAP